MDAQKNKPTFLRKISRVLGAGLAFAGIAALGVWGVPKAMKRVHPGGTAFTPYFEAIQEVQRKLETVQALETENERLKLENQALRQWTESGRFNCKMETARVQAETSQRMLASEAGALTARLRETITYQVPEQLLPTQLFTLGHTYFKAREDEKAAVIFSYLTELPNDRTFRAPAPYLLTGIAWYRLHHYREAERYFELILQMKPEKPNLRYQAQARLWLALSSERKGATQASQRWLLELLDHHPRAVETSWINRKKAMEARHESASEVTGHEAVHGEVAHGEPAHEEAERVPAAETHETHEEGAKDAHHSEPAHH